MKSMESSRDKKIPTDGELFLLVVLSILGVVCFLLTWSYSFTAALFPRMVSFAVGVLSLYTLAGKLRLSRKKKKVPGGKEKDGNIKPPGMAWYVSLLFMAGYLFLICLAGFITATLLYLLVLPPAMGYRRKFIIVLVAVSFAGVIFYSFSCILHVPLPQGWLGRLWS